nr:hypothetical transcript [Hymenolepis microstoma]
MKHLVNKLDFPSFSRDLNNCILEEKLAVRYLILVPNCSDVYTSYPMLNFTASTKWRGKKAENSKFISSKIQDKRADREGQSDRGDHIDVDVISPAFVEIVGPDKTIHLDYNCYDRVESLFQKVANLWNLEERRIELTNSKNVKLLNKYDRLSQYDIDGNDQNLRKVTLKVLEEDTIRITVQSTDGGALNISIPSSDTVLKLKERISYFGTRKTEEIRLMFRGKRLRDVAILNSRGMVDGSYVYALSRSHGGG